jgi:hypothetical protein
LFPNKLVFTHRHNPKSIALTATDNEEMVFTTFNDIFGNVVALAALVVACLQFWEVGRMRRYT